MTATVSIRRFALACAALLGFGCPAWADEAKPFKGSATETVVAAEPTPDGIRLTADGAGHATHLGKFTKRAVVVLHADGTLDGTVTFVAANGDELYAALGGNFSPPTIAGTYTFTGGTGRFAGATGTASFVATTDDLVHATLSFEGILRY